MGRSTNVKKVRVHKRTKHNKEVSPVGDYVEMTKSVEWNHASRAEKSRLAAKYRRDKEIEELGRLSKLLPFPQDLLSSLDKSAIIRLTISYLKMRELNKTEADHEILNEMKAHIAKTNNGGLVLNEGQLMLDAIGGFVLYVSRKGIITYVSENVEKHIGETQVEMLGESIFQFIHNDDKKELFRQFHANVPSSLSQMRVPPSCPEDSLDEMDIDDEATPELCSKQRPVFYIRMKYHFTKDGSKTRHSGYVLTQWNSKIKLKQTTPPNSSNKVLGLVAICKPMQSVSILEVRMDGNMFMSRHDLGMKFTFIDARIVTLVGYDPAELVGKTAYQFHNPLDAPKVQTCHSNLIVKGTSVSKYYRFLGKTGYWVWMQTRATIIYNSGNEPQYIVCMNYVIGEDEGRRYLMQEQEEKGLRDLEVRGAIDVTSLSSPGPTNSTISSGYCSAEEDHSYSTTRTKEPRTPDGSLDLSGPHTPVTEGMSIDLCPDAMMADSLASLGKKMNEYKSNDINLEDLIDDWLDADTKSPVTTATTTTLTQATLIDTSKPLNPVPPNAHWQNGFNPDIEMSEMMDVDHHSGLMSSIDSADTNESILLNLLKDSEKNGKDTHPSMIGDSSNHSSGFTADGGFGLSQAESSASTSPCMSSTGLESAAMGTRTSQDPVLTAPFSAYSGSCVPQSMNSKMMSSSSSSFPLGLVGNLTDSDPSIPENSQDFSLNLSSQQLGELSSYLGDNDSLPLTNFDTQTDDLNDNPFTSVLNDPNFRIEPLSSILSTTPTSTYQSLSSSPSLSSGFMNGSFGSSSHHNAHETKSSSSNSLYPGLDDHRYSSRQESPTHTPRPYKGPRKPSNNRSEPSVLEKFLTTRQTLNPNKGSDAALAAQGISQLNIKDQKGTMGSHSKKASSSEDQEAATLLKKLLTGEMDKREVTKHEQRVIADRRISANSPPHTQTSLDAFSALDHDDLAYDSHSLGLQLLGSDTADDMDKLWNPTSPDQELMMSSELDEILREQMRQDDLWLQHYVTDLL